MTTKIEIALINELLKRADMFIRHNPESSNVAEFKKFLDTLLQSPKNTKFSIDNFWKSMLQIATEPLMSKSLPGWYTTNIPLIEPAEYTIKLKGGCVITSSNIWAVSTPRFIESTLAREVAIATNSIYLNLAEAASIGGNYIHGGLIRTGVFEYFQNERTTLIIDSLDTGHFDEPGFDDFIDDLISITTGRKLPVVVVGDVNSIDDFIDLFEDEYEVTIPVFEEHHGIIFEDSDAHMALTRFNKEELKFFTDACHMFHRVEKTNRPAQFSEVMQDVQFMITQMAMLK